MRALLALAALAGIRLPPVGGQALADAAPERAARDPDRGLPAAFRARLARVDPGRVGDEDARLAALVETRLRTLATHFAENRLEELAEAPWIAPELAVGPLFRPLEERRTRNPWRTAAGLPADGGEETRLPAALGAWRAAFPAEARLETTLLALAGEPSSFEATLRLTAAGPAAGGRLQHDTTWRTRWELATPADPASGPMLVALRPEGFAANLLEGHPDGLFDDVTASLVGKTLYASEVAPGLDHWRARIDAALEPGLLGHHGLAVGDVDADGREDLYWCRPGGLPNKLLLHAPDDGVVDASAEWGVDLLDYSTSALLVELDQDADLDLVVATGAGLAVFSNEDGVRFERRAVLPRSLATSLAAADHDGDGDLDLFVCSYVSPYDESDFPVPYHAAENGEPNMLLRNDGDWSFVDVTTELGLDVGNRRFSFAASWDDFDADGDQDLYVANDFGLNNLYVNDGGRFREEAAKRGVLDIGAGMGVTWGDVDGDGASDLYVTNMASPAGSRMTAREGFRAAADARFYRDHALGNSLFLGRDDAFVDASEESGATWGRWGWGALFVDLDQDGALDLFAPTGFVTGARGPDLDEYFWREVVLQSPADVDLPRENYLDGWRAVNRLVRQGFAWNGSERNVAFRGNGAAGFVDVSAAFGLDHADDARAAAQVDWDDDGDLDLIVTNRSGPMLRILRNRGAGARWIAFELADEARTTVGARVDVETDAGRRLVRTLRAGEGYLAQSSARLVFGLGSEDVRSVSVRWPDGQSEAFGRPAAGALHVLEKGSGSAAARPERASASRLRPGAEGASPREGGARTVLASPLALPRLALETADGRAAGLFGIGAEGPRGTGAPLGLVLWSADVAPCRPALASLVAAADELRGAGLEILALGVAAADERARALATLDELGWPFARGFVTEEAHQILELALAVVHDDARALPLPTTFLMDGTGRLIATYAFAVDPTELRHDVAFAGRSAADGAAVDPEARRAAAVPFPGRWIAPPADASEERFAARLAAHGLERAAAELTLARATTRVRPVAELAYEAGVASHREGRLDAAIAHYERALADDPAHAAAAHDLAVALHQKGDRVAALRAYGRTLALDPADASTRCNLGGLYVELGDLEAARSEARALRRIGTELATRLAARLEQRIRASER